MNTNLLAIVNRIIAEQGEGILSEPRRVTAFFADLAQDEPKAQKYAFVKCLEHKSAQVLKNAAEPDRESCKQQLAQKLYDEEGLDLGLCKETLELLALVLFGQEKKKIYCKNCGKELQEEWKACPYCSMIVADQKPETGQLTSSAISSGSGNAGYGVEQIKPETAAPLNDMFDITHKCNGCFYCVSIRNECNLYNLPLYEAAKYNCKSSDGSSQTQSPKQSAAPITPSNSANQNTGALSGGQWFFTLLVAVGVAVIASLIKYYTVNINTILDNYLFGWIGGIVMYFIFIGTNKSKKK